MGRVKISQGNQKLGNIPSVSLPSIITCRKDCGCFKKCYARKLERLRPNVREAYKANYKLLKTDPDTYWREIEASIMVSRFFRYHVSGDIPDDVYLINMVEIADRNRHCEILCFTKKYDIVNKYLQRGEKFPENLHIILSAWDDIKMENPYNLPEAHIRFRNGITTAKPNAKECSGNCCECIQTEGGCWALKNGEQVVFNEH